MSRFYFIFRLIISTFFIVIVYSFLDCDDIKQDKLHGLPKKYYRIKSCYRMNSTVMFRTQLPTLDRCLNFAADKRGLAVNFSPRDKKQLNDDDDLNLMNCEVLGCPDLSNLSSLANDSRFDYYSLYGDTETLINASCIPYIGVFHLHSEGAITNYSVARNVCLEQNSRLAHVVSEQRTNGLAQFLTEGKVSWKEATFVIPWDTVAYVGLTDQEMEGVFVTEWEEPLECFRYRAWAPGHPRKNRKKDDCVIISDDKSWRAVNCAKKLPFFCELEPHPPYWNEYKEFANSSCYKLANRTLKRRCKMIKKRYKKAQKRVNYDQEMRYGDRCE